MTYKDLYLEDSIQNGRKDFSPDDSVMGQLLNNASPVIWCWLIGTAALFIQLLVMM